MKIAFISIEIIKIVQNVLDLKDVRKKNLPVKSAKF